VPVRPVGPDRLSLNKNRGRKEELVMEIKDKTNSNRWIYATLHYCGLTLRWTWVLVPANESIGDALMSLLSPEEKRYGGMDIKDWCVHEEIPERELSLGVHSPQMDFHLFTFAGGTQAKMGWRQ